MDVIWLILDSLSFWATPFASGGPDTMPHLQAVADDRATVFTNCYAPGPASPSSHGSFFTGELPSRTGMHEAYPHYDAEFQTIAEGLDTHRSFLISSNPFIFNGLYRGFDEWDDLKAPGDPPFPGATNPITFNHLVHDNAIEKYRNFLFANGRPVRSLVNGLVFRWRRRANNQEIKQYAEVINDRIREFRNRDEDDSFVVANYMEAHAPLVASDEAISRFASNWSRADLPIGVRGQEIHDRIQADPDYDGADMYALYRAAIWDLDRIVGPLIEDLVADDAMVVITADHGNWFGREHELDEERIHVPLIVFVPGREPRLIEKTVNLRSLPRTTMEVARGASGGFSGNNLLDVDEDQLSITEFIHNESEEGVPVTPNGEMNVEQPVVYMIAAIKDGARLDHDGQEFIHRRRVDSITPELEDAIEQLREQNVEVERQSIEYDDETRRRLEELGYID